MSAELTLHPDRLGKVPPTGAVESVQTAELAVQGPVSRVLNSQFLQRAALGYWRLITRFTLGLVRVTSDARDQCIVLLARPVVLLRFHAPEYEQEEDRLRVTWRIKRGILVARDGRDQGFLRLSIEPLGPADADGCTRVRMRMEVQNFYPWLRGTGAFARIGVWVYAQTQQRIHRAVTRRYLRELAESVGR
jgi:hypothetical protein